MGFVKRTQTDNVNHIGTFKAQHSSILCYSEIGFFSRLIVKQGPMRSLSQLDFACQLAPVKWNFNGQNACKGSGTLIVRILATEIPLYRPSPISPLNNGFSAISYSTMSFCQLTDGQTEMCTGRIKTQKIFFRIYTENAFRAGTRTPPQIPEPPLLCTLQSLKVQDGT